MAEPSYVHRSFYTWDHSTNWDLGQPGTRISGCHEPYEKPAGAFVADYSRCIDYMSEVGLNHLIIWGALRDAHGGVDALRQLVAYGAEKGVRVAPGVGVNAYGGIYYEGDHEYSLVRLLQRNPELAALDERGAPRLDPENPRRAVSCPRNPRVREWHASAIRWLMEAVGPQAIHFETGDYGICHCDICRQAAHDTQRFSGADIADALPPLVEQVRQHSRDCVLSYNYYLGYTPHMSAHPPPFVAALPEDVICKWGVSWMLEPPPRLPDHWEQDAVLGPLDPAYPPPTAASMAHLHFATGWWGYPKYVAVADLWFEHMPRVHQAGFNAVCTHGEYSTRNPIYELNYYVYAALAQDAAATPDGVVERYALGDLYGSARLIEDLLWAYANRHVPRDLLPRLARTAAAATGRIQVRLNALYYELQRFADRVRTKRADSQRTRSERAE
jgi:hypothetical protein